MSNVITFDFTNTSSDHITYDNILYSWGNHVSGFNATTFWESASALAIEVDAGRTVAAVLSTTDTLGNSGITIAFYTSLPTLSAPPVSGESIITLAPTVSGGPTYIPATVYSCFLVPFIPSR